MAGNGDIPPDIQQGSIPNRVTIGFVNGQIESTSVFACFFRNPHGWRFASLLPNNLTITEAVDLLHLMANWNVQLTGMIRTGIQQGKKPE